MQQCDLSNGYPFVQWKKYLSKSVYTLKSAVCLVFTNFKQCKNQPRFYTSFEWQIWETKLLSFCKTEVCSLFVFIFSHYRMIRYQIIKTFFEQWNVFWESMEYRVLDMLYVLFIVLFYLTENSALWCRVINWEFTTSVLTVLFLM